MQTHIWTCWDEVEPWEEAWRALEGKSSAPTLFQSWDWCAKRLQLNPTSKPWLILSITDGNELKAVLPLEKHHQYGFKSAHGLGEALAQYIDALWDEDERVGPILWEHLKTLKETDLIVFKRLHEASNLIRMWPQLKAGQKTENSAPYIDFSMFSNEQDLQERLQLAGSKSFRKAQKKLKEHGTVKVKTITEINEIASYIPQMIEWKRTWIKERGYVSAAFQDILEMQMINDLTNIKGNKSVISAILIDNKIIAGELGYLHKDRYYSFLVSYDPEWTKFSVGRASTIQAIRGNYELGTKIYDHLPPHDDIKMYYSTGLSPILKTAIPLTVKGMVLGGLWQQHLRPTIKSLFNTLPQGLRKALLKQAS